MRRSRLPGVLMLLALALAIVALGVGGRSPGRAVDEDPRPAPTLDAYQALSRAEEHWLYAHASEQAGDPGEAARRQKVVSEALARLAAAAAFTVHSVDCRSTTCLARLVWPDRPTAQARYRSVLHASLGLPCARSLFLRETVEPGRDYGVNLRIDCAAP